MSLVEALDKGCVPLLEVVRFRSLRCSTPVCSATRRGSLRLCHRGPFARPFAPPSARFPLLRTFAKINNTPAVQSAMCGVQ